MNDWGTNSFNRIMREHAEQKPPRHTHYGFRWHHGENPPPVRSMPPCKVTNVRVSVAPTTWKFGILFRWGSFWIGAHYAPHNKRVCINPVPFITIWITAPGGRVP